MTAPARSSFLAMLVLTLAGSGAVAEDGTKVYLRGLRSCVMVRNLDRGTQGSGSVVNLGKGCILTNWHVVRGGTKMLVVFPMWEKDRPIPEADKYEKQLRRIGVLGEVLYSEQKVDLAIIKIVDPSKIPKGTLSVRFASDSPLAASKIHSIGNPGASDAMWVYTPGEVRSVYKKQWVASLGGKNLSEHDAKIIEATSPTSPGDSGGPCFNDKMEQVGVTQGGLRSAVAQGYSYFIDASEVKNFLKSKKIAYNMAKDAIAVAVTKDPEPKTDMTTKDPDSKTEAKIDPMMKDAPKVDPAAEAKLKQEKDATNMLNLLRPLARDPNKQKFAATKLRDLVKKYPKTMAAEEALELLKRIE